MAAAQYTLNIEQHTDLNLYIVYSDAGGLVDLTGARVLFQVKEATTSSALLSFDSANLTTGQTIGTLDAAGVINATVAGAQTALVDFSAASWDLFVVLAGGQDRKLLAGPATLTRAVTQWV